VTVSQSWRRAPLGAHDQIIVKLNDDTFPTRGGGGHGGREVKGLESRAGKDPGGRAGKVPGAGRRRGPGEGGWSAVGEPGAVPPTICEE
jgi:hypothetical protein